MLNVAFLNLFSIEHFLLIILYRLSVPTKWLSVQDFVYYFLKKCRILFFNKLKLSVQAHLLYTFLFKIDQKLSIDLGSWILAGLYVFWKNFDFSRYKLRNLSHSSILCFFYLKIFETKFGWFHDFHPDLRWLILSL